MSSVCDSYWSRDYHNDTESQILLSETRFVSPSCPSGCLTKWDTSDRLGGRNPPPLVGQGGALPHRSGWLSSLSARLMERHSHLILRLWVSRKFIPDKLCFRFWGNDLNRDQRRERRAVDEKKWGANLENICWGKLNGAHSWIREKSLLRLFFQFGVEEVWRGGG